MAQDLQSVVKDSDMVLKSLSNIQNWSANCSDGPDAIKNKATNTYDCACDESKDREQEYVVVPKEHKLNTKHGIRLIGVNTKFKVVNENHIAHYLGVEGDDRGNTFGGDIGIGAQFKTSKNRIRVGLDYKLRQYTLPIEGYTLINKEKDQLQVFARDRDNGTFHLDTRTRRELQKEYGSEEFLKNQASVTMDILEVDMVIERPKSKNGIGLEYGIGVGYKTLDDSTDQLGANIQDNHHSSQKIYRFEWDSFSNLLIGGKENYLTLRPKAKINFPDLTHGICTLKSSTEFSVLFNTPIQKSSPNYSLNTVEPSFRSSFEVGLIPLKKNKDNSVFELYANYAYDPNNRLPTNTDPGNKSLLTTGLKINGNLGKRTSFYIIPIEFFIPMGKKDEKNILGKDFLEVDGQYIKAKELDRDVLGTWGEVGLTYRIRKN